VARVSLRLGDFLRVERRGGVGEKTLRANGGGAAVNLVVELEIEARPAKDGIPSLSA
jgi:hypothetical protein